MFMISKQKRLKIVIYMTSHSKQNMASGIFICHVSPQKRNIYLMAALSGQPGYASTRQVKKIMNSNETRDDVVIG